MTLSAEDNLTAILRDFRGDPQEAGPLAEFLGPYRDTSHRKVRSSVRPGPP